MQPSDTSEGAAESARAQLSRQQRWTNDRAEASAIGRVLGGSPTGEGAETGAGRFELRDPGVDLRQALVDHAAHVLAGRVAGVADVEDLADLVEPEAGRLGLADAGETARRVPPARAAFPWRSAFGGAARSRRPWSSSARTSTANVYEEWCPNSNFFEDLIAREAWSQAHAMPGQLLPLVEASALAAREWDALTAGLRV